MTKFEELKAKRTELYKQIAEESKIVFAQESKQLFERHPKLESFSWNQYTPYFNDGDTCEFSANTDYPKINGNEDCSLWGTEFFTWRPEKPANPDYNPEMAVIYKDVRAFLKQFDDDMLEELFGDHKTITVTKDKVEVESYDHD